MLLFVPMTPLRDAAVAGDIQAFGLAYDRYAPQLYGFLLRMLNDADEAQYVLQQTLLTAWTEARSFDPSRETEFDWLLMIARSRAAAPRRNRRHPHVNELPPAPSVTPPADIRAHLLGELADGGRAVTLERPLPSRRAMWWLAAGMVVAAAVLLFRWLSHQP